MIAATTALGTLPSWILVAIALAAGWRLTRGGAGSAVSELSEANKVLADRLQETRDKMGAEIRDLRVENARLRGRTDVALAINEGGTGHERRAQERHDATLVVLDLIAHRLGPDPNGHEQAA